MPVFFGGESGVWDNDVGSILMKLLAVTLFATLIFGAADAKEFKSCHPCADDIVAAMVVDLQEEGWWQMVPNGLDPDDETYRAFIRDALLSLATHMPKGKFEAIVTQILKDEP